MLYNLMEHSEYLCEIIPCTSPSSFLLFFFCWDSGDSSIGDIKDGDEDSLRAERKEGWRQGRKHRMK
ncbi:hypothetical protein AOLI_G00039120 [Acnodon oligacanthus]